MLTQCQAGIYNILKTIYQVLFNQNTYSYITRIKKTPGGSSVGLWGFRYPLKTSELGYESGWEGMRCMIWFTTYHFPPAIS